PGHTQIHQAIGGKGLHTRDGMYSKMAWGKQTGIQRAYSFSNPGDRVPLAQVKGKIAAFNRQSAMATDGRANLAPPASSASASRGALSGAKKPGPARTSVRLNNDGTGRQLAVKMRPAPGKGTLTSGQAGTAKPMGTLSVTNKLGTGMKLGGLGKMLPGGMKILLRSLSGPLR